MTLGTKITTDRKSLKPLLLVCIFWYFCTLNLILGNNVRLCPPSENLQD